MKPTPIRFRPIFKDKIWGGSKIRTFLGKDFSPLPNCGETWEISSVPGNVSVAESAPFSGRTLANLIREYKGDLVGDKVFAAHGENFPLLIKFIDAADDLSVQVHPGDALAKTRHNSFGKTEMWYILDADPGSRLIVGFKDGLKVDAALYSKAVAEKKIQTLLNEEKVSPGDFYFLPAGRIHAIGKGICLAEIQQTSDVTYRIYDFDRVDDKGKPRDLHVDEALEAMDFRSVASYKSEVHPKANDSAEAVRSDYFVTSLLWLKDKSQKKTRKQDRESFTILIGTEGEAAVSCGGANETIRLGQTLLIPACAGEYEVAPQGECKILEVRVP